MQKRRTEKARPMSTPVRKGEGGGNESRFCGEPFDRTECAGSIVCNYLIGGP